MRAITNSIKYRYFEGLSGRAHLRTTKYNDTEKFETLESKTDDKIDTIIGRLFKDDSKKENCLIFMREYNVQDYAEISLISFDITKSGQDAILIEVVIAGHKDGSLPKEPEIYAKLTEDKTRTDIYIQHNDTSVYSSPGKIVMRPSFIAKQINANNHGDVVSIYREIAYEEDIHILVPNDIIKDSNISILQEDNSEISDQLVYENKIIRNGYSPDKDNTYNVSEYAIGLSIKGFDRTSSKKQKKTSTICIDLALMPGKDTFEIYETLKSINQNVHIIAPLTEDDLLKEYLAS
jgi:hypothetical protein